MPDPELDEDLVEVPTLVTSRLLLRQWREADVAPYVAICQDPEVMRFLKPSSEAETRAAVVRHQEALHAGQPGVYAVETRSDREFIGFIGLNEPRFEAAFTPCVEIGWRLARSSWGQGYATEGARVVLGHAFDILGLPEVVSFTSVANEPSQAVMRRIGMHTDPLDDFDHPRVEAGHPFRPHVLYRLSAEEWRAATG